MGIVDDYAYGKKEVLRLLINFISNRIGKKYFTTAIRKTAFLYEFNLPAGIVIPIGFSFNRNLNFNGRKKLFSKKVLHIPVTHMETYFSYGIYTCNCSFSLDFCSIIYTAYT